MIPIETFIDDIQDIPDREITDEYLDVRYVEVYYQRFNSRHHGDMALLITTLREFAIEICLYLRTPNPSSPAPIDISTVLIRVEGHLSEVVMYLQVSDEDLGGMVRVAMLRHTRYGVLPRYELTPYGRDYNAYGVSNLAMIMHGTLGYFKCKSCHYSDLDGRYCGMGMEMYTRTCNRYHGTSNGRVPGYGVPRDILHEVPIPTLWV